MLSLLEISFFFFFFPLHCLGKPGTPVQGGGIFSGFAPHFQKGRQLHRKGRNQARAGLLQALGMTASSSGALQEQRSDVAISQVQDTRDLQHWLKHRSGADLLPQIYCQQFLPSATPCTLQRLSCFSQREMLPCSSWLGMLEAPRVSLVTPARRISARVGGS